VNRDCEPTGWSLVAFSLFQTSRLGSTSHRNIKPNPCSHSPARPNDFSNGDTYNASRSGFQKHHKWTWRGWGRSSALYLNLWRRQEIGADAWCQEDSLKLMDAALACCLEQVLGASSEEEWRMCAMMMPLLCSPFVSCVAATDKRGRNRPCSPTRTCLPGYGLRCCRCVECRVKRNTNWHPTDRLKNRLDATKAWRNYSTSWPHWCIRDNTSFDVSPN